MQASASAALLATSLDEAMARFKAALAASMRAVSNRPNIEPKGATLYIVHHR